MVIMAGNQNIWKQTQNFAGSKQDLAKQNEQSKKKKSGERWEGGSHRPDWDKILEAPSRKWKRNTPSSSPNNPAVYLIKTMKWNNGEGGEQEKSGWRVCLIFSSPLSLRATGPGRTRRPGCSFFSQCSPFSGCTEATNSWDAEREKKNLMRNRLKT